MLQPTTGEPDFRERAINQIELAEREKWMEQQAAEQAEIERQRLAHRNQVLRAEEQAINRWTRRVSRDKERDEMERHLADVISDYINFLMQEKNADRAIHADLIPAWAGLHETEKPERLKALRQRAGMRLFFHTLNIASNDPIRNRAINAIRDIIGNI